MYGEQKIGTAVTGQISIAGNSISPPKASFMAATINELENLRDKIGNATARLSNFGDRILGARPEAVGEAKGQNPGAALVTRTEIAVNQLHGAVDDLIRQIERIESL